MSGELAEAWADAVDVLENGTLAVANVGFDFGLLAGFLFFFPTVDGMNFREAL